MYSFSSQEGGFVTSKNLAHKFHSAESIFPTQGEQWFCFG